MVGLFLVIFSRNIDVIAVKAYLPIRVVNRYQAPSSAYSRI